MSTLNCLMIKMSSISYKEQRKNKTLDDWTEEEFEEGRFQKEEKIKPK